MPPERIGIFGGTFDPPHLGHLILASEAREQLSLASLLWVLTPIPPHKLDQEISSLEQRLDMVRLAIAGSPEFELSRIEIDRPGPHYTLDTLELIRIEKPRAALILIVGGDSLRDLPAWHRPADLLAACSELGVMRRPGDSVDLSALESAVPGVGSKVRFVDAPLLEISSSEIRKRVAEGRTFRHYLPGPVFEYIRDHSLYR